MSDENKAQFEEYRKAWELFKQSNEKLGSEVKASGAATVETKAEMAKLQAKMAEFETKLNRPPVTKETTKEGEISGQVKAFLNHLRGKKLDTKDAPDPGLIENATGQLIVPWDMDSEIQRAIAKIVVIRGLSAARNTTSNRVRMLSMNEALVGWGKLETSEGNALSPTLLIPAEAFQYVEDQLGMVKLGVDEMSDTDVNLLAYLTDSFSRALGEAEDSAFVVGTGHTNVQPMGLLTAAMSGGFTRVDTGAVNAVSLDDLLTLIYSLPAQYRRAGSIICHSSTILALRLIRNEVDGSYAWAPAVQAGQPPTLFGYGVYAQDDLDEIPSDTSVKDVILFGDIKSAYRILDRQGMTIEKLDQIYRTDGLIGFLATRRVGGAIIRSDAAVILATKSVT